MRLIRHSTANKPGRPTQPLQPRQFSIVANNLSLLLKVCGHLDSHGYAANRISQVADYLEELNVYRISYQLPAAHKIRTEFERAYGLAYRETRENSPKRKRLRTYHMQYKRELRLKRHEAHLSNEYGDLSLLSA
jgi:hypothetical protein